MMEPTPVALFCYNRPDHTRQTIEALRLNSLAPKTELHIFSDGPKNDSSRVQVNEVRRLLKDVHGFKSFRVMERETNLGLARSIISGVSGLLEQYGRVIVLEDDVLTAPDFLAFINEALKTYALEKRVFSVTGLNFPIAIDPSYPFDAYVSYRCSSWGWATWQDRWQLVDWNVKDYKDFRTDYAARRAFNRGGNDLAEMLDCQLQGKLDSWAVRWCYAHYKNDAFCIYAVRSRVKNIGFDGTGVHCQLTDRFSVELSAEASAALRFPLNIQPDPKIAREFHRLHSVGWKRQLKFFVKRFLPLLNFVVSM
jgi:hypothetical protein